MVCQPLHFKAHMRETLTATWLRAIECPICMFTVLFFNFWNSHEDIFCFFITLMDKQTLWRHDFDNQAIVQVRNSNVYFFLLHRSNFFHLLISFPVLNYLLHSTRKQRAQKLSPGGHNTKSMQHQLFSYQYFQI